MTRTRLGQDLSFHSIGIIPFHPTKRDLILLDWRWSGPFHIWVAQLDKRSSSFSEATVHNLELLLEMLLPIHLRNLYHLIIFIRELWCNTTRNNARYIWNFLCISNSTVNFTNTTMWHYLAPSPVRLSGFTSKNCSNGKFSAFLEVLFFTILGDLKSFGNFFFK